MRVRNALLPWRPSTSTDAARFEFVLFILFFLFDSFSTLELFLRVFFLFFILFKKKLYFFSLRFKKFFFFFSLFTILLSCSSPIVSWISSPSNPSKFPLSFFIAFFRNIPRFSKLRLIATRFFHSPNAPATALHRHHSHTYLRVISLTVLSPRCIVLLCVLLCLKSFAHLLTSQDF